MQYPTFLIIGVSKGGTTAMYHQLKEHPSIYMSPVKEARYFAFDPVTEGPGADAVEKGRPRTLEEYQALFAGVTCETAVGEASPFYFEKPGSEARIHAYNPEMKLILALRHPVDRAESHYLMQLNRGAMPNRSFSRMFREEILGNPNWREKPFEAYNCLHSLYSESLQRYLKIFPREQILILKHEDILKRVEDTYPKIFEFLGVDPSFLPDPNRRYHVGGGVPRSNALRELVVSPNVLKTFVRPLVPRRTRAQIALWLHKVNRTSKTPLEPADRREFMSVFREDTLKTQELAGIDLSNWLD